MGAPARRCCLSGQVTSGLASTRAPTPTAPRALPGSTAVPTTVCAKNHAYGVCWDVGTKACSVGYLSNLCPGGSNIRCCPTGKEQASEHGLPTTAANTIAPSRQCCYTGDTEHACPTTRARYYDTRSPRRTGSAAPTVHPFWNTTCNNDKFGKTFDQLCSQVNQWMPIDRPKNPWAAMLYSCSTDTQCAACQENCMVAPEMNDAAVVLYTVADDFYYRPVYHTASALGIHGKCCTGTGKIGGAPIKCHCELVPTCKGCGCSALWGDGEGVCPYKPSVWKMCSEPGAALTPPPPSPPPSTAPLPSTQWSASPATPAVVATAADASTPSTTTSTSTATTIAAYPTCTWKACDPTALKRGPCMVQFQGRIECVGAEYDSRTNTWGCSRRGALCKSMSHTTTTTTTHPSTALVHGSAPVLSQVTTHATALQTAERDARPVTKQVTKAPVGPVSPPHGSQPADLNPLPRHPGTGITILSSANKTDAGTSTVDNGDDDSDAGFFTWENVLAGAAVLVCLAGTCVALMCWRVSRKRDHARLISMVRMSRAREGTNSTADIIDNPLFIVPGQAHSHTQARTQAPIRANGGPAQPTARPAHSAAAVDSGLVRQISAPTPSHQHASDTTSTADEGLLSGSMRSSGHQGTALPMYAG